MFKITFIVGNRMAFTRCATLEKVRQLVNALEADGAQVVSIENFCGETIHI